MVQEILINKTIAKNECTKIDVFKLSNDQNRRELTNNSLINFTLNLILLKQPPPPRNPTPELFPTPPPLPLSELTPGYIRQKQ